MKWLLLILLGTIFLFPVQGAVGFNSTYSLYGFYPSENMFINHDGLRYQLTARDGIKVMDQAGRTILNYGIGVTGNYGNQTLIVTEEDYEWTYSHDTEEVLFSRWEIDPLNESDIILINYTMVKHIFTARNNDHNLNWTEEWEFTPKDDAKVTHILTNNWNNITGGKFWYILKNPKDVRFNNARYDIANTNIDIEGDYDSITPRVGFPFGTFLYDDLLADNFHLTNVYIGNADRLGYANKRIMALGFSKGAGNFNIGQTVTLDPSSSGFLFFDGHSEPFNQWTNPSNMLLSDNVYATETTIGDVTYLDYDGSAYDETYTITGFEVRAEGISKAGFCPLIKPPSGRLHINLSLDNGTTQGTRKIYLFPCTIGSTDSTFTFGNSSDTWGLGTLNGSQTQRIWTKLTNGPSSGGFNPGMDQVKLNIWWELPAPVITALSPSPSQHDIISSTYVVNISSDIEMASAILETNQTGVKVNHTMTLYNNSMNARITMSGEFHGADNGLNFDVLIHAESGGDYGLFSLHNLTVVSRKPNITLISPLNGTTQLNNQIIYNMTNDDNESDKLDVFLINNFNGTIHERNYFYYESSLDNSSFLEYNSTLGSLNSLDHYLYRYFKMDGLKRFGENSSNTGFIITNLRSFDNTYGLYQDFGAGHTPDFITTDCKTQGCLEFDGTSDAIVLEETPTLEFASIIDNLNFTMGGWFNKDDTSTMVALAKGNTVTPFFQWRISGILIYNGSGASDISCNSFVSPVPTPNRWEHWVVVANGSGILYYVNGEFKEFDSCDKGINISGWEQDTDMEVYLGAGGGTGADLEFDGTMDEVFIYNRSITAEEVRYIYNNSRGSHNWTARVFQSPNDYTDANFTFNTFTPICQCSSASCVLDCANNCVFPSLIDLGGTDIIISGTSGTSNFNGGIVNQGEIRNTASSCVVAIR